MYIQDGPFQNTRTNFLFGDNLRIFLLIFSLKVESNLFLSITQGKDKNWLPKTGGPLLQVFWSKGPRKCGCLTLALRTAITLWSFGCSECNRPKTGDPLIQVAT